jgi:hypothetical protein
MRMIRLLGVAGVCAFTMATVLADDAQANGEEPYTIQQLIDDLNSESAHVKGLEILQDVEVDTLEGKLIFNQDYRARRAMMLIAPTKYCGVGSRRVLMKEIQGDFQTWWCKDNLHNVAADFYDSSGGSVALTGQNKKIPCTTPGIPATVYAQACP